MFVVSISRASEFLSNFFLEKYPCILGENVSRLFCRTFLEIVNEACMGNYLIFPAIDLRGISCTIIITKCFTRADVSLVILI